MSVEAKFWIIAGVFGVCILLYILGPILTPFFISALLAWLGDPLADRLETWKFPRGLAVVVVFIGTFLILGLLLLLIVPMVSRETAELSAGVPRAVAWFQNTAAPWLSDHLHIDPERLRIENLSNEMTANLANAGQFAGNALATLGRSGHFLFAFALNLLLVPVVTFYWLKDWDIFKARLAALLPRDKAHDVRRLAHECERVLAAFFHGQLLVVTCLTAVYSVGLTLVGLDNGFAIGVIAGILSFVPYVGIATGIVLALLAAVLQPGAGWLPLWVLLVFGTGQALDSSLLTPRLVGERIGLHPVLVIFAILAGGALFGFVGVVLALPAAAAGTVFARHAHARYLESDLYRGEGGGT
ncbi:MAG: AI-2E family transporter [Bacillota bacterium]